MRKPMPVPLTVADHKVELFMRDLTGRHLLDHSDSGGEFGLYQLAVEWVWIINPIDGPKSFISGSLAFITQIALIYHGKSVLGIIITQ